MDVHAFLQAVRGVIAVGASRMACQWWAAPARYGLWTLDGHEACATLLRLVFLSGGPANRCTRSPETAPGGYRRSVEVSLEGVQRGPQFMSTQCRQR